MAGFPRQRDIIDRAGSTPAGACGKLPELFTADTAWGWAALSRGSHNVCCAPLHTHSESLAAQCESLCWYREASIDRESTG